MTGKLFKYEMKSTARYFLPAYAVLLGLSILTRLFGELSNYFRIALIPSMLLGVLYVLTCIGTVMLTEAVIIYRFYKNMTGSEAYLMFTLPVNVHEHIFIKLTASLIWTVAGVVMGLLSLFINMANSSTPDDIKSIFETVVNVLKSQYGANAVGYTLCGILIMVLACTAAYLMFYASISLGQCSRTHRFISSVAAYFGLYIANQIILFILMISFTITVPNFITNLPSSVSGMNMLIIALIVILLAESAAYYLITHRMMSRHLNLE